MIPEQEFHPSQHVKIEVFEWCRSTKKCLTLLKIQCTNFRDRPCDPVFAFSVQLSRLPPAAISSSLFINIKVRSDELCWRPVIEQNIANKEMKKHQSAFDPHNSINRNLNSFVRSIQSLAKTFLQPLTRTDLLLALG